MTAKTRIRAAAIATMAAVGALGLPSQALAGKSHHLKLYKVEQHVDVEGDTAYDVSCNTGDIATDGMWRIDDVSQDNEFDNLGQWTLTVPTRAEGDAANAAKYWFEFLPIAGGDVQVKLIVTCLENPTTGTGHSHAWNTARYTATPAVVETIGPVSASIDPGGPGLAAANFKCPAGKFLPITPGFDFSGDDGYGYVTESWYDTTGDGDAGWEWEFNVVHADATDTFDVDLSYRCLERKSVAGGGHSHRIVQNYKEVDDNPVPKRTFRTHEVRCGEHYKGMVGMWDIDDPELYFLGMDPRIKHRAFKFVNPSNNDHTVELGLSCFKDRTT